MDVNVPWAGIDEKPCKLQLHLRREDEGGPAHGAGLVRQHHPLEGKHRQWKMSRISYIITGIYIMQNTMVRDGQLGKIKNWELGGKI